MYCALVRPITEYCTVAWMPFTKKQIDALESIQKQFLLFALRNLGWSQRFELPSYESRLNLLNIDTLENRRVLFSSVFMYKLINGNIDVNSLRDKLNINNSAYATRNRAHFMQNIHSTNYGMNEPIHRLVKYYNLFNDCLDECNSFKDLKIKIRIKLLD